MVERSPEHGQATVEAPAEDASVAIDDNGIDVWDTDLGRLLAAARAEFLASRGHFLRSEEFEREWAEERGERRWLDEE